MARRLYPDQIVERKDIAILRILAGAIEPLGAQNIASELENYGIDITERAVRYHLRVMDERGLTSSVGDRGRVITLRGRQELDDAMLLGKLAFVQSRIEALAYRTTLDLSTGEGEVLVNASLLPRARFEECLEIMRPVFRAGFCMSTLVAVADQGDSLGDLLIPEGAVGFGTVCTVTLNGILLQHGIPVESRFGGLVEVEGYEPVRFTELISYAGSTLDPAEVFIKGRMTRARQAASGERGKILGSFREVPAAALPDLNRVAAKLEESGIGGILAIGRPAHQVLDVPVGAGRIGVAVVGGLTPVAALSEAGIPTINKPMKSLVSAERMKSIWENRLL